MTPWLAPRADGAPRPPPWSNAAMRRLLPCVLLPFAACALVARMRPAPEAADWSAATWRTVVARPEASLRGLSIVDANDVWAGGDRGTLLRSVDGGVFWQDVAPPDTAACDFRDVHAFDHDNAIVMVAGQPARLYRTADGGATWAIVHHDPRPEVFFDAIAFDGDRGYLLGDPLDGAFMLLRSDDRGGRWTALPGPRALPGEAAFAASGTCLQAGGGTVRFVTGGTACRIFTSGDGGQSWSAQDLPLRRGAASQGGFGIGMAGCDGIVVGGDYAAPRDAAGTAARTVDGSLWFPVPPPGALGYRSAALWFDASQVLAVGEAGASFSRDRGQTWRPFGSEGFHALARGRDGAVFACGGGGRVARLELPR